MRHVAGPAGTENAIEVDYTQSSEVHPHSIQDCLLIDRANREYIESTVAQTIAAEIHRRLPRSPAQFERLLRQGYKLASRMSWEVVARDYVLPGIEKALAQPTAVIKKTAGV